MVGMPVARTQGLIVERLGTEALVYDTEHKRVHCLAPLAAAVFDLADGTRTELVLADLAGQRLEREVSQDEVSDALVQLDAQDLLQPGPDRVSRRQMVRRVAVAGAAGAVGVTLVKTIAAPTPAQAQSTTSVSCAGDSCSADSSCCTGFVCSDYSCVPAAP